MTGGILNLQPAPASAAPAIGSHAAPAPVVILSPDVPARVVEQYRKLAAGLHLAQSERRLKVVAMASAAPADGKTLTAVNLAITFAESYHKRVLLIDADLRRPSIHSTLGIPNGTGLSEELRGAASDAPDGFPTGLARSVLPRLDVVTAGEPNCDPIGDLASERMQALVRAAADAYDWTIIDTPAVGLLPDARLLTVLADAILFVVRAGSTPYPLVQRALEAVGRSRVLGVVMNSVTDYGETAGYDYGPYYERYHSGQDRRQ